MEDPLALILDSGTGYLKAGWSNETFPSESFPALVGRPMLRFEEKIGDIELKPIMVGDEAAKVRSYLELSYPVDEGVVKNWDDMALVWNHAFERLKPNYSETKILMTEPVLNPKKNREKMCEKTFEHFGFSHWQIGIQAVLSTMAEGLLTACVLDAGDGVSHVIPMYDGYVLEHIIERLNIAGRSVTERLIKLLLLRGYAFNSTADFELVREMKEKFCFVSHNLEIDRKLCQETTCYEEEFLLPDGTIARIGRERFEAPEIMFNPLVSGSEQPGVAEMLFNSINKSDLSLRKSLYESILISGGSSLFPGFPTRLKIEMEKLYRNKISKKEGGMQMNIVDAPRRRFNVFIGGGVLASTSGKNENWWISKAEWMEHGASIIGKKCLNQETQEMKLEDQICEVISGQQVKQLGESEGKERTCIVLKRGSWIFQWGR